LSLHPASAEKPAAVEKTVATGTNVGDRISGTGALFVILDTSQRGRKRDKMLF
jgi:hypothetical protein